VRLIVREGLLLLLLRRRSIAWRGIDHQKEAFCGGRKLGDVVFRMSPADVLLYRAVSLLLISRTGLSA
jgi:hypothetical protein